MKRICFSLFCICCTFTSLAQLYWRTDGASGGWTSPNWSNPASPTGGTAWTSNTDAIFSANSTATFTSTSIGNVTVNNGITATISQSGTLSTNNAVRTFNIGTGSLLTWVDQAFATTPGVGIIKNGTGTWDMGAQPNTFDAVNGGFTLNAGTIIEHGDNNFGGSTSLLTINGGTIQSSGGRLMSVSSIVVGGNFIHSGSGNAIWPSNMYLGNATRTISNNMTGSNNSRLYSGVISGNPGVGIIFNGTAVLGLPIIISNPANTYTGATTINGAEVEYDGGDQSFGPVPGSVTANSIVIDGGRLTFNGPSSFTLNANRGIHVGASAGTAISVKGATLVLSYNGVISDKPATTGLLAKNGSMTLQLGGVNTYSGSTYINNGTIRLSGNNSLPSTTTLYMGEVATTNLGIFDLNGFNQTVGGLNSNTGISMAVDNTITSSTPAILTVNGGGSYGDGTTTNSGIITGAISLVKSGAGTLVLADANTYTGSTTVSGGTLQLNKTGGTTILSASNVTINGGILKVSTNQSVNNLSVSSGTLVIDPGVTLTVNGSFSGGGTITNNGTMIIAAANNFPGVATTVTPGFNNLQINAPVNMDNSLALNGSLILNGTFAILSNTLILNGPAISGTATNLTSTSASSLVFGGASSSVFIPSSIVNLGNLTVNNSLGVSINSILVVYSSVQLTSGTLTITAGNKLDLNGASLTSTSGYIAGSNTSDLAVRGSTGGIVTLPVSATISLRNIAVSDTRTLKLNGVTNNDIKLYGALTITVNATFDNGGESQLINWGGSISISGKFITRDVQGFTGSGAAIPTFIFTLNTGSTIEYGLTGGMQAVTTRSDYKNLTFSGSGIKLLSNTFSPTGNVYITGAAIVDAVANTFGNASTNLIMDGGRFRMSSTSTKPDIDGTYTLTGGVIEFYNNLATQEKIKGRNAAMVDVLYNIIEVTGSSVKNSTTNITLRPGGSFIIKATGVFEINDEAIIGPSGSQTFTIETGGVLKCGNPLGFNGPLSGLYSPSVRDNIETIILQPNSTVNYSRSSPPLVSGNQVITNTMPYENMIFSGTGNKTAPGGSLIINGNLTKSGTAAFIHNNGTVVMNGTGIQSYTSNTPVMAFYNLTDNNIVDLSTNSDLVVAKELAFANNAKLNLRTGYISLLSTETNTANVGNIPSSAVVSYQANTGFIAERYIASGTIPGHHTKSWQFLSVPVNESQTVNASWQEGSPAPNNDPKPGYGTQITSNIPGATGLGFDVFTSPGPSMKVYDPAGIGSWDGIPNTTSYPIYNSNGYMIFVRGDRSVINFSGANSAPVPTVLRAAGKIFAPVSNPPLPVTVVPGKFASVGNPYASSIDLTAVNSLFSGDVQNIFYVWDPRLTTGPFSAYGLGGYRTLSYNGADYDVTPAGGSYGSTTKYIQSGQAFFVKSFSTGGSVNFNENCKSPGSALVTRIINDTISRFRTNLYVTYGQENILIDGAMLKFSNDLSNNVDKNDALKLFQTGENLSIYNHDTKLAVESKNLLNARDTIEFRIEQLKQHPYVLEFIPGNMEQPGLTAYLEDNFLHSQTPISLRDTSRISFVTDINTQLSMASDRFRIIFIKTIPDTGFSYINVSAERNADNVVINWETKNDQQIIKYEIEKSDDGLVFYSIEDMNQLGGQNIFNYYSFINPVVTKERHFYRINATSINGTHLFSRVCTVDAMVNFPAILIYPNPVAKKNIQLHFVNAEKGIYQVKVINSSGMIVRFIEYNITGPLTKNINVQECSHGIYNVVISTPHHKVILQKAKL